MMWEQKEKLTKISINSLFEDADKSVIKNFMISNDNQKEPEISLTHPFIFDGVAFAICRKGTGKLKINLREYSVEANTIITLLPDNVVEFLEKDENALIEFLVFSFDFISDIKLPPNLDVKEKLDENPCLKITEEECLHLLDFHAFIVKQYNRTNHVYRKEITKALLHAILIEIISVYNVPREISAKRASSHRADLLNQLLRLLLTHYREERSVAFYADKMCLTSKYLSKIIKEISGKSIMEWISETVIMASKALLKSSEMTVLQISEELNFPNPSFFSRFFKKHTGMTPIEYRESE